MLLCVIMQIERTSDRVSMLDIQYCDVVNKEID